KIWCTSCRRNLASGEHIVTMTGLAIDVVGVTVGRYYTKIVRDTRICRTLLVSISTCCLSLEGGVYWENTPKRTHLYRRALLLVYETMDRQQAILKSMEYKM